MSDFDECRKVTLEGNGGAEGVGGEGGSQIIPNSREECGKINQGRDTEVERDDERQRGGNNKGNWARGN